MDGLDFSSLRKVYIDAKNKHNEYVEPLDKDVIQTVITKISNELKNVNPEKHFVEISLREIKIEARIMNRISDELKQQNINHVVYGNFRSYSILIKL